MNNSEDGKFDRGKLKTRDQLARELGVSTKTIYRKLKEQGFSIPRRVYLTPHDQEKIYEAFNISRDSDD